MRTGPIIIIEDDEDDQVLVGQILKDLSVTNPVRFFANGLEVLDYLTATTEQPFLIFCDVNMPLMNGLELRRHIDEDETLRKKVIPFIFLTTTDSPLVIAQAYEATIQGFFQKAVGYEPAREQMRWIIGYWQHCLHPYSLPQ